MTSLLNSTSVRSHDFYQYLCELFHLTTIFGARVFDPQHCGKTTPLELFSGFRRERLLRVTDPRSALVAASPRCDFLDHDAMGRLLQSKTRQAQSSVSNRSGASLRSKSSHC